MVLGLRLFVVFVMLGLYWLFSAFGCDFVILAVFGELLFCFGLIVACLSWLFLVFDLLCGCVGCVCVDWMFM